MRLLGRSWLERLVLLFGLLAFATCDGSAEESEGSCKMTSPVLYDKPVSNHGGRARIIIYKKELEKEVIIKSPDEIGGLKSEEYLKLNPQGKMPLLITEFGAVPESDTIARYLLDRYSDHGASFNPGSLEGRTLANHLARLHDTYITPIQGCLYRSEPPFGQFAERSKALKELKRQWEVRA